MLVPDPPNVWHISGDIWIYEQKYEGKIVVYWTPPEKGHASKIIFQYKELPEGPTERSDHNRTNSSGIPVTKTVKSGLIPGKNYYVSLQSVYYGLVSVPAGRNVTIRKLKFTL